MDATVESLIVVAGIIIVVVVVVAPCTVASRASSTVASHETDSTDDTFATARRRVTHGGDVTSPVCVPFHLYFPFNTVTTCTIRWRF